MSYATDTRAVWEALRVMQGNVGYIKDELPKVTLPEPNRNRLVEVLGEFDSLLYDLRTEARNLEDKLGLHPGEPPFDPDIKNPDPRVTMRFLREWPEETFHALLDVVQDIEDTGEDLAFVLVAESAANMLKAKQQLRGALQHIDEAIEAGA